MSDAISPVLFPQVGVGVLIRKEGKVLFGQRKVSHGIGTWAPPGGKLDFGESLESCAEREVMEETGLTIKNIQLMGFTNDIFQNEKKHFITIWMVADCDSGTLEAKEPDKCAEWIWVDWNNLPQPLFLPTLNGLKKGYNPFRF